MARARSGGQAGDVVVGAGRDAPVGHQHEQRPPVVAPQHAGEAGHAELHSLEYLAAVADAADQVLAEPPDARPDGTFGVDADPVGSDALGPCPAVREASVVGDVEAVRRAAKDSATISVEFSGVTAMPLGNAIPSATRRTEPSGVIRAMIPGASPAPGSKAAPPLT